LLKELTAIDPSTIKGVTRDEFKKAIARKGYSVDHQKIDKIFSELDTEKQNSIKFSDFRHALLLNSDTHPPEFTLNKICQELKSRDITVEQLFKLEEEPAEGNKRRRQTEEQGKTFHEFMDTISKLGLEIDIVDLETLFTVIDKDHSGEIDKKELTEAFKKFDSDKVLNLNSFRKALYKHLNAHGLTLNKFYKQFDVKNYD
jgi:Ca2+-binding EF-hand superfamily protein